MKIDFIQGIDNNWSATLDLKCFERDCPGSLVFDQKRILENAFPITSYCFHIPVFCSICGTRCSISLSFKGAV